MKTTVSNLFMQISKTEIENLTQKVNETVAFGVTKNKPKIFSAADLWNIERQGKAGSKEGTCNADFRESCSPFF